MIHEIKKQREVGGQKVRPNRQGKGDLYESMGYDGALKRSRAAKAR